MMKNDTSNHFEGLERYNPDYTIDIKDYQDIIGVRKTEEIRQLAGSLEDKRWVNLNSTLLGGGVAEILRSAIPLARGMGLKANWYVIKGTDDFFKVTKKFHNMLQGIDQKITLEEIFGAYLDTINQNAMNSFIASDLVVLHDPQPMALIMKGVIFGNTLWRCHIDTSRPNQIIWRFLLPYINLYSGAIFTMPEFVGPGLQVPLYQISPCIDPLAEKNKEYSLTEAEKILSPLFETHQIDPERPILTAISRYDIHKNQAAILKAFKILKKKKKMHPPPYLIFLGNTATDDPEGGEMLEKLQKQAGDDPDVRFWVNVENNDQVVGALMRVARAFIHVSTREGFGLVVAEALWQGTPVIGSQVGGLKRQVIDGQTGYMVDPGDSEQIAQKMAKLLEEPNQAEKLGAQGKEHVRQNFLLPDLVNRYMCLLRFYSGVSQEIPQFRLDTLSYSEILQSIRIRNPYLPKPMPYN
jgi:trehalose synthase